MYKGLDILKFFCALLVVYIHTYCFEYGWGWIKVIADIAVPFFFLVSGFFFGCGLQKNVGHEMEYTKRYSKRILVMYLLWTLITLPVEWMNINIAHSDYSFTLKLAYIVRGVLFCGSLGIYWYILSMIYDSWILYYCYKKKKIFILSIIAFVLWVIGLLYEGGAFGETLIATGIHAVFGSNRNFLNVGMIYMTIGFFFSKNNLNVRQYRLLAIFTLVTLILIINLLPQWNVYGCLILPISILLFILGLDWHPNISDNCSILFRKYSTILYLCQFPFILIFDYYLKRGTLVDYPCTVFFSLILYYILKFIFPPKLIKALFG